MKTSARFLAVILAVLMIAGAAITVSAFSDVADGYAHAKAVATLNQLGIIGGYEDGTFKPENNVERDEMAKLIFVLYTTLNDAGNGSVKFNDVAADNWAAGYVSWCAAKSIVGGYGDGTFKPDNNVTYDEALKMVCAALGYTDFDSNLWPTDVRQKGLKELKLGTDIDAKGGDKLTRGEVAQLLYNALTVPMNEFKVTYVYNTSYKNEDGTDAKVKVPVEEAKTLAEDVWGFEVANYRVVGTKTFALNNASKSSSDKIVKTQLVNENDGSLGAAKEIKLAEYGLEAYEKKTDELIALDIMIVTKDEGKTILGAEVLGSYKTVEIKTLEEDDALVLDEIEIDGVLYGEADGKTETVYYNLKTLTFGASTVTTTAAFADTRLAENEADPAKIQAAADAEAKLNDIATYPMMALALDSEGDGVVDAIAIDFYKVAEVTKTEKAKDATTKEEYTKYYYDASNYYASTAIDGGKTLAKGDVFVYAEINDVVYVIEVLAPITSKVSKVVPGAEATLTLTEGDTVVKFVDATYDADEDTYADGATYLKGGNAIGFTDGEIATLLGKDAKADNFYIYNDYIVAKTTNNGGAVESYDYALLLYVKDATDPVYNAETQKIETTYPAVLLIDGKEVTVNLNLTDAIDGYAATAPEVTALKVGKTASDFPIYAYKLVTYTVDEEDGTYTLATAAAEIITGGTQQAPAAAEGDTVIVETNDQNNEIKYNARTGLYTLGGKAFELDDKSVIYYTYYDEDVDTSVATPDGFQYLGTYNKANILAKFDAKAIAQRAYLRKNADNTYTLIATVINGVLTDGTVDERDYTNDARLIKYCAETSVAQAVDGVAYYSYLFLDMSTMKNGSQTIDTTLPIKTSGGATKAEAGKFYGWDQNAKKYVEVKDADSEAVKVTTITAVNAGRNMVEFADTTFTIGNETESFAGGIVLTDDVKIWSTTTNAYTYTTFTVEALAELFATAEDYNKTISVAVGTYVDENDEIQIAWMIVDNYVLNDAGEDLTIKNDIVSRIESAVQPV